MAMEYQDKHCNDEEVRDIAHEVETIRKSLDLPEPEEGVVINTYESLFSYYKNIFLAHALAKNIRAELVKVCIDEGADPNGQDEDGNTPLMHVFFNPTPDMDEKVKILLDAGADIEIENDEGFTALWIAVMCPTRIRFEPYNSAFRRLMSRNPKIYNEMLVDAILGNNYVAAKYLVASKKVNVNFRDIYGVSMLEWARRMENKRIIALLQKNGAEE